MVNEFNLDLRNKIKNRLITTGIVGASLVGLSGMTNALPSVFWVDEDGTKTDLKTDVGGSFEPELGNPTSNGYILSSTTAGVRSWIAPPSGGSGTDLLDKDFSYDVDGYLERIDYSDSTYKEFVFDVNGNLTSIDINGDNTKSFTYDVDGNLVKIEVV